MHQTANIPVLRLQNVEKKYGQHEVLNIPDWTFNGGICWIQGQNGAGKSTFFRVLAGMLPFSGNILLDETYDIRKNPITYRLKVNLGEAEPLYPSFLTPNDLLTFVAETKRSPSGQAEVISERLGITGYLNQPLGACSSGMVKKLSLALAFLGEPRLIILDEPLITIDKEAQNVLLGLIQEYHEKGVSFLISSHQLFESNTVALTATYRLVNKTLVE